MAIISIEEARKRVFMFDIDGLLVEGRPEGQIDGSKCVYTKLDLKPTRNLVNAIEQIKPTVLIGASGSGNISDHPPPPYIQKKINNYN
jgi:malate dehydrogenase (oxaloacetate-decarboxylating)(NADP+)